MNKTELKEIINEDKEIYYGKYSIKRIYKFLVKDNYVQIGKYVIYSRKAGFYKKTRKKSLISALMNIYYTRKKNKLGQKLNIELQLSEFGRRLKIYHGNIIINGYSKIGNDCELHGNNCIGNKGNNFPLDGCPVLGNNIELGIGSNIIGKIKIADGVKISSNSLVNKDILEENIIVGGVPAKKIK